jgi:hypothetical protein
MKSIGTFFPLYFQVVLKPQYVLFDVLSLASDLSEINLHFTGSSKIQKGLYCAFRNLKDPILWLLASKKIKIEIIALHRKRSCYMGLSSFWPPSTYWPRESQTWKAPMARPSLIHIVMCPISIVDHQNLSSLCVHIPNRFFHLLKSCSNFRTFTTHSSYVASEHQNHDIKISSIE